MSLSELETPRIAASSEGSRRPKLCIVTQYFPPEMGAPQVRLFELGVRLIDLGWDVEVLTALPNYPTGSVFPDYDSRRPSVEQVGRLRTVRVPLYTENSSFPKRLRSFFSFAASAARYGPRLCEQPSLMYVQSPPLFIGYAAQYLSWKWRCPYVLNVSDLWPDSAVQMGVVKPGLLTRMASRLERKMYRKAAAVTGPTNEIIDAVANRVPGTRTELITNGVDPTRFSKDKAKDQDRDVVGRECGPIFTFAGLLGHAQGLDQLLDLASSLPPEVPGRIVIVGDGPNRERLERRVQSERIERVRLVPSQPSDRIPAILAASDVAIITLGFSMPGSMPSKIYEAMAASLPILLVAENEAAHRVEQAECGLVATPGDLPSIHDAFCRLASDASLRSRLGSAGRIAAETQYNRLNIAKRLDRFLLEVVGATRRRDPPVTSVVDGATVQQLQDNGIQ